MEKRKPIVLELARSDFQRAENLQRALIDLRSDLQPFRFLGNSIHNSYPDPDDATHYYAQMIRVTLHVEAFASQLPEENPFILMYLYNFLSQEVRYTMSDVETVLKKKTAPITYTNGNRKITSKLSILDIYSNIGDFPQSELEKHYSHARYVYDRLSFLVVAINCPTYGRHLNKECSGLENIAVWQKALEKNFSQVLARPPAHPKYAFWKQNKDSDEFHQSLLEKVRQGHSPIRIDLDLLERDPNRQNIDKPIFSLPPEMLLTIFQHLNPEQLLVTGLTCRLMNRICGDQHLWESHHNALFTLSRYYDAPTAATIPSFEQKDKDTFEKIPGSRLQQKASVVRQFRKMKAAFAQEKGTFSKLMMFHTPSNPYSVLLQVLGIISGGPKKDDLIFACNQFCRLLQFSDADLKKHLPEEMEYQNETHNTQELIRDTATYFTGTKVQEIYIPPKEIFDFLQQTPPDTAHSHTERFPWISKPIPSSQIVEEFRCS